MERIRFNFRRLGWLCWRRISCVSVSRSQRPRDEAAAIEPGRATDPEDAAEFKAAKAEITRDILNNVFREYRAVWIGAVLIAIAFGGKLISAIPNFFWL